MFFSNDGTKDGMRFLVLNYFVTTDIYNCLFAFNRNVDYAYIVGNNDNNSTIIPKIGHCVFYQNKTISTTQPNPGRLELQNCLFYHDVDPKYFIAPYKKIIFNHCYFDTLNCSALPNVLCENLITGVDPMFVNPDSSDFHLRPCSPLVDAGLNIGTDTLPFDFDGTPRIQRGAADIGAYELPAPGLAAAPEVSGTCPGGASGAVTFQVDNGCAPFTYVWASGSASGGPGASGLSAGTHIFTITDAQGASFTASFSVPPGDSPVFLPATTPAVCGDTLGGSATATLQGGAPPYAYHWAGGSADSLRAGLPAGAYPLTITDARGCSAAGAAEVDQLGNLSVDIEVGEISCAGAADGAFTVLPANGKAPFAWLWSGGATGPTLAPIGPGNYLGTLTDALGCSIAWILPLGEPAALQANPSTTNATAAAAANGRITLQPTGGTAPYTALWSTGATGLLLDSLAPGAYGVTLTDAHGCTTSETLSVGVSVGTSTLEATGFALFPNPARTTIGLFFGQPVPTDTRVLLFNAAGKAVWSTWLPAGARDLTIPVADWPRGMYWVAVNGAVRKVALE